MNGHLFTVATDAAGQPIRQPLHLMTPAEVEAAVRIQRATVRRLGKAALPVLKRVAADPANRDTGQDMNTMARNLKASDADRATIRELLAERARQDQLTALIRAEMPQWNPERRGLPDALAIWWPRFPNRSESGTPATSVN
jgi:Spy/CpxP family protein refolding chaperone